MTRAAATAGTRPVPRGADWRRTLPGAALVLLAESTDLKWSFVGGTADGWGVFFAGAGVIVLLETALRLWMREHRASWWWTLIGGLVLLWIPSDWEGWYWIWSLVLAAVGVAILRGAFARDRSSGKGNRDGESWRDA